jgi:hypothetical protein
MLHSPHEWNELCNQAEQQEEKMRTNSKRKSRIVLCVLPTLKGLQDGSVGPQGYSFVSVPLRLQPTWAPFRSSKLLPIASVIHPAQLLLDQYPVGHEFLPSDINNHLNIAHLVKHFSGADESLLRVSGTHLNVAKDRIGQFSLLLMPQFPYESTKLLCTMLQWGDCNKRAAEAVQRAIDIDEKDMKKLDENKAQIAKRHRSAVMHAGAAVGMGLRLPKRVDSLEGKLKQALAIGHAAGGKLFETFSKKNDADLVLYRWATKKFAKQLDAHNILVPDGVPYSYAPMECDYSKDECCALRNTDKSAKPLIERCNNRALANYKQKKAFVFFHHITHHAGTFLCKLARKNVGDIATPPFICNLRRIGDINRPSMILDEGIQYCTSESPLSPKDDIPFGSEKIVFIHILRHPIARFLSGDGGMQSTFPESKDGNYTRAARSPLGDNYALRFLAGASRGCLCGGNPDPKAFNGTVRQQCRIQYAQTMTIYNMRRLYTICADRRRSCTTAPLMLRTPLLH